MKHITIAKNTLYQVLARVVSSGTSFFIVLLIIHRFSLEYGDFAKITAFVSLFYLVTDFGFNAMFLQTTDNKKRFRDLLYPRIILAGIVLLIVNLLAFMLPYNHIVNTGFSPMVRLGIGIFSVTLFTEAIMYTCLAVFQRELKYVLFLFAETLGGIVTLATVALLIFTNAPLLSLLYAYVLGGIIQSITALFLTRETVLPARFNTKFFAQLAKSTLPIGLMLLFNLLYTRIDIFILAIFRPTGDVAIYDLAYKFFDFLVALPLFLSNSLYPMMISHKKNNRMTTATVRKFLLLFFTLALPLVAIVWIISPFIRIIKPEFGAAAVPLRILTLSLPMFFSTSILQWILIAQKQQKKLMTVYFFATIANILLNLYFIPLYGYVGSAVITGISEAVVGIILGIIVFTRN